MPVYRFEIFIIERKASNNKMESLLYKTDPVYIKNAACQMVLNDSFPDIYEFFKERLQLVKGEHIRAI